MNPTNPAIIEPSIVPKITANSWLLCQRGSAAQPGRKSKIHAARRTPTPTATHGGKEGAMPNPSRTSPYQTTAQAAPEMPSNQEGGVSEPCV